MMIGRIGPGGRATLIVGVIEEAFRRAQVGGIDDQLLCRFVVGICTIAEEPAIAHKKWHAHEDTIPPKLMCPAGTGGVPKAALAGSWIAVETLSYLLRRQLVSFVFGLLI